jgi:hypothetical protein
MGLVQAHALGRQQRVFIVDEGTPNALAKATAASALRVKSSSLKEVTPRENRADARDTRSRTERITRAKEVEWALSAYMLTGMDPGDVTSRLHPLLRAVFGGYTNTPGTSDLYTLSSTQVPRSLSITRQPLEGRVQEIGIGCVVNQATFSLSQGDEPMAEFSGPGLRYAQAMGQTTTSTVGAGTTKTLSTVEGLTVDSVVAFADSNGANERNNGGAGYRITAINGLVITLEALDTSASGNIVYPYTPTPTDVGSPISGIIGALTLDSVACPIKSFSLTIANNNAVITEALEANASDHVFGDRDVTGTLTVRARADLIRHFALRRGFTARDLDIVCGAAGNRWTFALPTIEIDATAEMNLPVGNEEGDFELPFTSLGSGENEITLLID